MLLLRIAAFAAVVGGLCGRVHAEPLDAYLQALVERAVDSGLGHDEQWLRLGHWRTDNGRITSEVDDPAFFLAHDGPHDPEAELIATLYGLLRPALADGVDEVQHPACRFPARLKWLHEQLDLDLSRLQQRRCPKYERYLEATRAESATVVFSAYHLSSAASAFGHTLLRLNKPATSSGGRQELLDTGINYAASVDTNNALLYAWKGMFGMFRGEFSQMPYYYKVRQYNDYDSRDLWEYELDLAPDELRRLVDHVWELGSVYFQYWYMTENCSYHILGVIEVARPSAQLTSRLKWPVIPADTVKLIANTPGLVRSVGYRPSLGTQFRARLAGLDGEQTRLVTRLADDAEATLPASLTPDEVAPAFDAAMDLVDIRHADEVVFDTDSPAARHKHRLLTRRAQLGVASEPLAITAAPADAPDQAHGSTRLGAGAGVSSRGAEAVLRGRLAFHDLADPVGGLPRLTQIEFLPTELRIGAGGVRLERSSLVRVRNLVPLDRFDPRPSWHIDLGFERQHDQGCDGCGSGFVRFGAGGTLATWGQRAAVFALLDSELVWAPELSGGFDSFRAMLGPLVGTRLEVTRQLVFVAEARLMALPAQSPRTLLKSTATLRWALLKDHAVDVTAAWGASRREAFLGWLVYL